MHALFDFSKIFVTEANIKDNSFYYEYESLLKEFKPIVKLYDKVRNYVTKKPYSIEKIGSSPNLWDAWKIIYKIDQGSFRHSSELPLNEFMILKKKYSKSLNP